MTWAFISIGFVTGMLGSAHCVGMCGPIALALPVGNTNKYLSLLLYNLGRAFTYSILGLLPGLLGFSLQLAGLSQWISISLGVILLLFVIFGYGRKFETLAAKIPLFGRLKQSIGKLFKKSGYSNLFVIGLLNGLLPCGLVYTALLLSVGTGEPAAAALFMFMFGMGTLPAMYLLSVFGNSLSMSFRQKLRKAVPYMLGIVAILLIIRGLNLGIPLLSPSVSDKGKMECCERE